MIRTMTDMEVKTLVWSVVVLYSSFLIIGFEGAVSFSTDPCPEPYKVGDTWDLENCEQCRCMSNGYECFSCGKTVFEGDTQTCYAYFTKGKRYPECCRMYVKCRGEPGFDENLIVG